MKKKILILFILLITGCTTLNLDGEKSYDNLSSLNKEIEILINENKDNYEFIYNAKIDSLKEEKGIVNIYFGKVFSYNYFREWNVEKLYNSLNELVNKNITSNKIRLYANNFLIEDLIPNFYRSSYKIDEKRIFDYERERKPIVKNISLGNNFHKGLENRNIVIWHSHGWYYANNINRWEWQRSRMFNTVEDLLPMAITIPYIVPMLENAGANVFIPRERDLQTAEIIIDNDELNIVGKGKLILSDEKSWEKSVPGFAVGNIPYKSTENPFLQGSFLSTKNVKDAFAKFVPEFSKNGEYAVYIAYKTIENSTDKAIVEIKHAGGITKYEIDQQQGGGTWIYLGTFKFISSWDEEQYVKIENASKNESILSVDAVRFGGGLSMIEREGVYSGRPKFTEGSRYYLQLLGMPDTLVYFLTDGNNDYIDDYRSRGEYVNYLIGKPFGPNRDRNAKGLNIPIDASVAFHTDAGITRNDTTIGTLSIYSFPDIDSNVTFPNGFSRLANRDFADILQTQLVEDFRAKYDPVWNRRMLYDAVYSECARPNVPSVLLELLSHQNFLDMKFANDPRFQFDAGRAIYKSIVKYLSALNGFEYEIQPIPVNNFHIEYLGTNRVKLSWHPVIDELEPTAKPTYYKVYTRIDSLGFDNGVISEENYLEFEAEYNKIYSFKVTALNAGGESFPSEILAIGLKENIKPALIVNGFDRIDAAYSVDNPDFSGFVHNLDNGVPYIKDINFTGAQYDFNPHSKFISNDFPGHGSCTAEYETQIIAGNTFDYPYIHGKSMFENGLSFISCSDESVENGNINLKNYYFTDIIFGEEKLTDFPKSFSDNKFEYEYEIFSEKMMQKISDFLENGGKLFISGAYLASDLKNNATTDSSRIIFAKETLNYTHSSNYASKTGLVYFNANPSDRFNFNVSFNEEIYAVEAPDSFTPVKESETLIRYSDNDFSAVIGFKGKGFAVISGFPFETVELKKQPELMKFIIDYLEIR